MSVRKKKVLHVVCFLLVLRVVGDCVVWLNCRRRARKRKANENESAKTNVEHLKKKNVKCLTLRALLVSYSWLLCGKKLGRFHAEQMFTRIISRDTQCVWEVQIWFFRIYRTFFASSNVNKSLSNKSKSSSLRVGNDGVRRKNVENQCCETPKIHFRLLKILQNQVTMSFQSDLREGRVTLPALLLYLE